MTVSPHDRVNYGVAVTNDTHFYKLKTAIKGGPKHQHEIVQTAAAGLDASNLKQMMV